MIAQQQAWGFAVMALCGFLCAAAYDGMMLLRRALRIGDVLGGAMDLAFGMAPAALMTLAALEMRTDPFRLYMFAAVATGMLFWFGTLGRAGRRLWHLWEKMRQKRMKKRTKTAD
ncbi:MAG: spore cortex biosynthesis protein YabQ [Clostridia bacterium]|nr:spore cortex biosynthesis protein YabQ [Clostridia bacterium]